MQARSVMLICLVFLAAVGGGRAAAQPGDTAPPAPKIAPADQQFVTWMVRRVLEQYAADGSTYDSPHRPTHLARLRTQMAVTLRRGGAICGVGVSPPAPILEAARQAAIAAFEAATDSGPVDSESLARTRLEIEAIGEVAATPIVPYWGSAQSFAFLEPGVHGIVLQLRGGKGAMRPSEFVSNNLSVRQALRRLNERMNPAHESHQGMMASWFRTTHWHELEPGGEVVQLKRGLVVLGPEVVTEGTLTEAIHLIAEYMIYRQLPSGEFSYQYEPSTDTYAQENNYVRQADAAWGLVLYARQSGAQAVVEAADKTTRLLTQHVMDLPGVEGAGYFRGPDGSTDLGATALLCLALTDHPQAGRYRAVRDKLVAGMCWLQKPSGRFITVFPPTLPERGWETFPGQALLALARVYAEEPQDRIEQVFAAALPVYRGDFRKAPQADFVPWHTQAFALMARRTGRRDYADFVFEMNDWLAEHQLDARTCPWPELYGGIDPPGKNGVSAATALYLEGFADALVLARELGDAERARRYALVVRAAARLVLQLQFRRAEGFYVRSGIDCFDGVRNAPWDNRIRIDNCRHALSALSRAREVLFFGDTADKCSVTPGG